MWLYLRQVDEVEPNVDLYPDFDAELRAALRTESGLLFMEVLFGGAPANDLILADYTFVNDRLAEHYGLPPVGTDDFVRVDLTGNEERPGGILSHASVLTVTSHPTRTSPVLRGKWVLNQIVCGQVPPPPFDVNTNLPEMPVTGLTTREQLEQHRSDPVCSSCHSLMDPLGFGLENYDPVGAFRSEDNGAPIDASGELKGIAYSGPSELREIVAQDEGFVECVIENLYTYALGRVPDFSPEHLDGDTLGALTERFRATYDFRELIHGIVESSPFVSRRAATETDL
jgi:hypothetical protein